MKKKISFVLVAVMLLSVLSGCRVYSDFTVNPDGTTTRVSKTAMTEEELKEMGVEDFSEFAVETLEDGKQYYVSEQETDTMDSQRMADENDFTLTGDIFYYEFDAMEESGLTAEELYLELSVTLLGDVAYTNADLMTEGKTAVFTTDNKDTTWYAYTEAGKAAIDGDVTPPVMKGVKEGKYYKKMPANMRFVDDSFVNKILLNGIEVTVSYDVLIQDDVETITGLVWRDEVGNDVSKSGKNVFVVTDIKGNTATYSILIDKKAPVIKGVKDGKSYQGKTAVYVKDAKKLKSVAIAGKNQKLTDKKLVKSGKYKGYYKFTAKKAGTNKIVAKDEAGNKKVIKIKIEK